MFCRISKQLSYHSNSRIYLCSQQYIVCKFNIYTESFRKGRLLQKEYGNLPIFSNCKMLADLSYLRGEYYVSNQQQDQSSTNFWSKTGLTLSLSCCLIQTRFSKVLQLHSISLMLLKPNQVLLNIYEILVYYQDQTLIISKTKISILNLPMHHDKKDFPI